MVITILASIVIVLILLIIVYILFNTYIKTRENYSNTNTGALSPSSYNSTNCKPKTNEVQYPTPYNDSCNLENSLDTFLTTSKFIKNKQLEPALSLHTLPKLHSSKKLLAYNEYCDISQSSITNKIPDAYNEYCKSQIRLVPPPEIYSNVYKQPTEPIIPRTLITIPTASPRVTPTANNNSDVTQVHIITTRPRGYGNINGWYSTTTSTHLLDNPLTIYYEQMLRNYAPDTWKIKHIPVASELPDYGSWWNWASELENINKVIDYLGTTLGKFETHIIAPTPIINPLIWVKKQRLIEETSYNIINTTLENMLLNKINTARPNANIVLTQEEWSSCNITTNIITLHYINVGSSQYRPFSQVTYNVNSQALAIIANDWKIGSTSNGIRPNLSLRVEECGGVCLKYMTKNNRQRIYMAIDLGMIHTHILYGSYFNSMSNDAKKQWLRDEIYASITHEYTHVFQDQLIEPLLPGIWFAEDTIQDERSPNAISRWWFECFATLLPYFMGFNFSGFDIQSKINDAINKIKNNQSLTATEFSDRMMYINPYGYLPNTPNHAWSFLVAAYMAKLKTWKYVLVDFYYDFQRVPSDTPVTRNGTITYVPDLDKLFLHNFNKTEEAFLQDIYAKVKTDEITIAYLSNVLPDGANFGIPELIKFNQSNLINPTFPSIVPPIKNPIVPPTFPSIVPSTFPSIVPSTNSLTTIEYPGILDDINSNTDVVNNNAFGPPINDKEG